MIEIKYIGTGERQIGEHVWNQNNGFIQAVETELAANLIAYPRPGQFQLVPNQKLTKKDKTDLARLLGVSEEEVTRLFSGESNPSKDKESE